MKSVKVFAPIAALMVIVVFAGCEIIDGITGKTNESVPVTGVLLNKTSTNLIVGATETLFANVKPDNATNKGVTWISGSPAVATVSASGEVTGLSAGTATIIVATVDGGKTASCTVTVGDKEVPVTGVLLNKTSTSLTVGGTETLFANIEPSNATNKNVTWISGSPAVATVSSGGVVTGLSAGTAAITVTTVEGGKTASCTVTVSTNSVAVTGVSLNKTSADLAVGGTENLIAAITPSNATNQSVTWASGSPAVATVSGGGVVTGLSAGTATITVTTVDGGKTASCTVTIDAPVDVLTGNRYQAAPYAGTDKIKYSYSYNGYDYYYIYLGQLGNIPLFYDDTHRHSWVYTSTTYTFETTNTTTTSIANTVTTTTERTVSVSNEHTVSATTGGSLSAEIGSEFNLLDILKIGGKVNAESNWSRYTSNTSGTGFQLTTSLTNTVEYATSNSNALRRSRDFVLTRADREGYYRYTYFSVSDVYLYVIRDPSRPDEIYYEFREHIIPSLYFWDLDYSETPDFNKSDATRFGLDISILKSLPVPAVTLYDPPVQPTGVVLNKTSLNLDVGGKETLTATITPSNATVNNVTWSTSNAAVATVSETGAVTAISAGAAIITVTTVDGNLTAICNVTVVARPTSISLNKTSITLDKDNEETLTATITPSNAANKNVTWSSSNTAVAVVSTTGTVTAVSAGSAIITVKTEDGNLTAECNVTVRANSWTVNSQSAWNSALTSIRNGGNGRNYIITVSGNVPVAGRTDNSFGNVSNVTVTINGNGKLYLNSQGSLLVIGSSQTVRIDSANLTLQGLKKDQNSSSQDNNASVVSIAASGKLELRNGTISGNTYNGSGGGVYVNSSGSFTMSGGTISGNVVAEGGGVYVNSSGSFTMSGGSISGNAGVACGGGVFVNSSGSFTMSGGSISGTLAANSGGGVFVNSNGSFTMSGGSISGNVVAIIYGGGVYVNSKGSFTMKGGTISGNSAIVGGGVSIDTSATFNKSGSSIIYGQDASASLKNTAIGTISIFKTPTGHAVYWQDTTSIAYLRNTTAGADDNLSTSYVPLPSSLGGSAGGWTRW